MLHFRVHLFLYKFCRRSKGKPRRNVVVESAQQRRLRMLCQERTEALLPLLDQMDINRAQYNNLLVQMNDIQRRVEVLQQEARRLAARIDEERRYYDYSERTLASWPQDHHEELAAPSTARFNDQRANRELEGEWEPTMPSVPSDILPEPQNISSPNASNFDDYRLSAIALCSSHD